MALRSDALDALPVRHALPALRAALEGPGVAVLGAPPGTGKTTLVPLALAGLVPGAGDPPRRVLVAEPRRMAARAAARRMAWLLGEETGDRVGFTVRGERRAGPRTRVEVVTTGVLLQRLQRDPELAGVDAVLLDECHERHLDADTALAFLVDVRATLRPELRLVAASATSDTAAWARLLTAPDAAAPAPVVRGEGTMHAVAIGYRPPPAGVRPAHGTRVDPALLAHIADVVREGLRRPDGDLLCFLPGVGEIARVAGLLTDTAADVLQLHGQAPAEVQNAVLRGSAPGERRVILSTAVAESSLTVPGVRIVVDGGLAREPRMDHARGLGALTTVRVSAATATQRLGRAGREGPGLALRCWSEAEDGRLPRYPSPEIAVADLAGFALQAACWGDPDATGLALLDAPPPGALAAARDVLRAVGAVDAAGRPTPRGTRLAGLGLHPRLGRALLDAAAEAGPGAAAEAVALLSEEPPRSYGDDLAAAWRRARRGGDAYAPRWRREAQRLRRALRAPADDQNPANAHRDDETGAPSRTLATGEGAAPPAEAPVPADDAAGRAAPSRAPARGGGGGLGDDAVAGIVAALAFPERVARGRGDGSYLMASGTRVEAGDGSALRGQPWLAVAVADRPVGAAGARLRLGAPLDEATALRAAETLLRTEDEVTWSAERHETVARRVTRLGAVELRARPLPRPDPARLRAARLDGLRREGTALLRWSEHARALRRRLAFLHGALGDPWPAVSDDALLTRAGDWLDDDPRRIDAGRVLQGLLPWARGEAARLDELAPERIEVPSGSRIRVDYEDPQQPVLAVKLQELFGLDRTPRIADGRVPLLVHLLSPAGRPAAVTADLESFWRQGYPAVRAELRGRYPKHPWPEDPATATPTRHTTRRTNAGR
ncbi:helicase-related protein [Streptomyces sp. NBC_01808]|uniref:ATP-dependent RNA helicase n=1 Tax=Streptomyces sp. NBC_01808 TaxID=2975947 RepID=UPI002DDBBF57|nr:ATP-dependent helicase C-terminal domain-containing protein [Streptomyces sp. NBC_01808]WSA37182.1 helicase-related protein [Streptomyces sp. NBC_01808]